MGIASAAVGRRGGLYGPKNVVKGFVSSSFNHATFELVFLASRVDVAGWIESSV